jgi:hypothetical protein
MNRDTPPAVLPVKGKPLKGHEARQVATWLYQWTRRKPAVKLSVRNTCWLAKARRGIHPLSAGRFHAILRYVQTQKHLLAPRKLTLSLTGSSSPSVNWGDPSDPMGGGGAGPGIPLPSVPQKNFRE